MKVKLGGVSILAVAFAAAAVFSSVRGAAFDRSASDALSDKTRPSYQERIPPARTANMSRLTARAVLTQQSAAPSNAPALERAFVDKYCVGCHSDRAKTGGLTLQHITLDNAPGVTETWEKVARKLRGGMMPPLGAPRPDQPAIDQFVSFLETSIDRAALNRPNPGRSPLHRLNRAEYANAIRDLLALDIDATALLPADDEANGFDNIADVLKVSPSLLEQYLTASRKIASLAVGDSKVAPASAVYRVPPDRAQGDHVDGLPLGTRGGIVITHNFPLDADYDFRVNLLQNIVGYVPGLEWPHTLEISIDGERVFTAPVGGEADNKLSDTNLALAKETLDQRLRTRIPVKAGPRVVGVAFIKKSAAESVEPLQPFTRDLDMQNMNGVPLIEHVQIGGPFNPTGAGDTPSRRRIFVCQPAHGNAREEDRLCENHSVDAGAARVSASHRHRNRYAARLLRGWPQERHASTPASRTRCDSF